MIASAIQTKLADDMGWIGKADFTKTAVNLEMRWAMPKANEKVR